MVDFSKELKANERYKNHLFKHESFINGHPIIKSSKCFISLLSLIVKASLKLCL